MEIADVAMARLSAKSNNNWRLFIKIVLFFFIANCSQANRVWPAHYTEKHIQLHKQAQSSTHSHLKDFEVVIPFVTDENYIHLSHFVRHRRKSRLRRDAIDDVDTPEKDGLRYSLTGYGQEFKILLKPNHLLLAPNFSVKKINKQNQEQLHHNANCHYHGSMTSHQSRAVAMSTCNGLTGLLRAEDDDYLLEPIPGHLNHSFDAPIHPHLIYKRRHLEKGKHLLHYCGKKQPNPVMIPKLSNQKTINLLSNGEIELEDVKESSKRFRRSIGSSVTRREGLIDHVPLDTRSRPERKVVETLVVADRTMIENHKHDHHDVTNYVLTIMNMVSSLFSDHSLDGRVDFVLVGLILMEDNNSLILDHKADISLSNFCKWQLDVNQSDGRRPDHSILITGIDICVHKNSPCETLGLAQIGGMCSNRHSCTINEDMGLGLAFTIAHESGHSFGMKHDGQGNSCSKRQGHVMSPTLSGLNGVFSWSACSREALTDFLHDRRSSCLDDHPLPSPHLNYSDQLPGQIYGADQQCKWQFGSGAYLCPYRYSRKLASLCKTLWCQEEGGGMCETKHLPAAEGTPCGDDMWCRRGVCVPYGSSGPRAIDGNWGNYEAWSGCTRTCGGGIQYKERSCTNPTPKYGGRHCEGKSRIHQLCNVKKCPPSQIDFRSQQCASFNSKPYRRQYFSWIPFTKYFRFGRDSCNLLCQANGFGFFDLLADKVIDGTPCDNNSLDVCIDGKCQHVGCDYVLGSNATYDICGVCNGRNSTCSTITGHYMQTVNQSGYYEVARIPRGARNVKVWEERCCTHSYIAVQKATSPNTYYLNGNWHIDVKPAQLMAGVEWNYKRKDFHKEYLHTIGHKPINEDIIIEVLVITENPGIKYSYSITKKSIEGPDIEPGISRSREQATHNWHVSYGLCSSSCAGGIETSIIKCVDNNMTLVDDEVCEAALKPAISKKKCNTHSCPPRWIESDWSDCSRTCDVGEQHREVTCKAMTLVGDMHYLDDHCDVSDKPEIHRSCQLGKCPAQWYTGTWTKCSRQCGRGRRKRRVYCQRGSRRVRQSACNRAAKPQRKEKCIVTLNCQRQYQWLVTNWTQCSSSCGKGVQRRKLKCSYIRSNGRYKRVTVRKCNDVEKPQESFKKSCFIADCPVLINRPAPILAAPTTSNHDNLIINRNHHSGAQWMAGAWQKCTVSCGGGVQMRAVKCLYSEDNFPSSACVNQRRPISKRQCNTYQCSLSASNEQDTPCVDNFTWCILVPQHNQCSHSYFGGQCCKSCSNGR